MSFRETERLKRDWDSFATNVHYCPTDINEPKTFENLKTDIEKYQSEFGPETQVIYYLAVAPNFFPIIAEIIVQVQINAR